MKGLNLFLAACFAVPMMDGAVADTLKNGRENAVQRTTTTTQNRTNTSTKRTNTTQSRTANQKNIIQRTTAAINTITEKNRNSTPARDIVSRTAKKQTILTRNPGTKTTTARTATPINRTLSRAATDTKVKTRESVMQRDFGKCKSVFFDCMDEFCANKDAQLKRCACSTRANEFRNTQKSPDNVEDKLLDFSQRLLQINMDPADAAVINVESEGEKAYNETKDNTASKKALDEIAKKLNTSFESAENGGGMSALTWSLDADSAFDSVDSFPPPQKVAPPCAMLHYQFVVTWRPRFAMPTTYHWSKPVIIWQSNKIATLLKRHTTHKYKTHAPKYWNRVRCWT